MKRRYSLTLLAAAAVALAASQGASAADLPARTAPPPAAPAYVPPPVFSWTGFYVGGNLGVAWTDGDVTDSFGHINSNISQNPTFTGGGQVGANYQWNWLVVGVEADFDWLANSHNSTNAALFGGDAFEVSFNDRWITTVTGRVGYAFNWGTWGGAWGWGGGGGPWLIYGKGGWGWAGVNNPTLTDVTTGTSISLSNSNSDSGPVGGVGVEWAFLPNWTVKLEYDILFLNTRNITVPAFDGVGGGVVSIFNRDVQTVTVGINYLFNWR